MLIGAGVTASIAYAAGYNPFYPLRGIKSATTVPHVYGDGSTGTMGQIGHMADGSVQQTDANARMSADVSGDQRYSTTAPTDTGYYQTVSDDVCATDAWSIGTGWQVGDTVTVPNDGSVMEVTSVNSSGGVTGLSMVTLGSAATNTTNMCAGVKNPHGSGRGYAPLYLKPTAMKYVPFSVTRSTSSSGNSPTLGELFSTNNPPTAQNIMYAMFSQPFPYIQGGQFVWPNNTSLPNYRQPSNGIISAGIVNLLGSNTYHIPTTTFDPMSKDTIPYVGDDYIALTMPDINKPSIYMTRADKGGVNNTQPMLWMKLLNDDPVDGGNSAGFLPRNMFNISAVETENAASSVRELALTLEDHGTHGYEQQNYNFQNIVHKYGLAWTWAQADEIDEMGGMDYTYPLRSQNKGPSTVEYMAEHNLNGVGVENDSTYYTSRYQSRINQLASHGMFSNYVPWWKPNTQYKAHQMIRWADATTGYQYLFTTDSDGTSGATIPDFGSHENKGSTHITVDGLSINNGGSGYKVGEAVTMSKYVSVSVSAVDSNGSATKVDVYFFATLDSSATNSTITQSSSTGRGAGLELNITFNYNQNDTLADGSISWIPLGLLKYQVGTAFLASADCVDVDYPAGYTGPTQQHCIEVGTAFAMKGNVYNTVFDTSAVTYKDAGVHAWARATKDSFVDLSADGTASSIDNHILGFSTYSGLSYGIKTGGTGANETFIFPFTIGDDGHTHLDEGKINTDGKGSLSADQDIHVGSSLYLGTKTKAEILALSSPVAGEKVFNTDDQNEYTYRCPTSTKCAWFPVQYGMALSN